MYINMQAAAQERVQTLAAQGAARLNRHMPRWRSLVIPRLITFGFESQKDSGDVLSQIFKAEKDGFAFGLKKLCISPGHAWKYGFALEPIGKPAWEHPDTFLLTKAWGDIIRMRNQESH